MEVGMHAPRWMDGTYCLWVYVCLWVSNFYSKKLYYTKATLEHRLHNVNATPYILLNRNNKQINELI